MSKSERNQTYSNLEDVYSSLSGLSSSLTGQYAGLTGQTSDAYSGASSAASDLATTGGISDEDASKMERTASRGVKSVYDVASNEAKRKAAITGGYGGTGALAQMARQSGQKQAESITDTQSAIAGLRQQGKIAGTSNLTNLYGLSSDQASDVMNGIINSGNASTSTLNLLSQLSSQPGTWSKILGSLGGVGSIISAISGAGTSSS
jgi:hypothetical protein